MSDLQSLANQLSWCMVTKNYLGELNDEIRFVSKEYVESIERLKQNYIIELLPDMKRIQQEFEDMASELIRHIEDEHLEYVDRQSQGVQGALGRIMG